MMYSSGKTARREDTTTEDDMTNPTTKAPTRAEVLATNLEALQAAGVIGAFAQDRAANGDVLTSVSGPGEDATPILSAVKTPVAEAFVLGTRFAPAKAARKAGGNGGGVRKPNPYRDAIEADGFVEVQLSPVEDVKTERNKVFLAAYSLGLKGAFKVTTTKVVGGTDGATVTGYLLRGEKKA